MEKFRGKFRNISIRLQSWDYGWNALYFVTICTANRECFFGKIDNGQMILSEIGKLSKKYWLEIPEHFSYVKLDAFVVMPNHIHGIIEIDKKDCKRNGSGYGPRGRDIVECRCAINRAPTTTNPAPTTNSNKPQNQPGGITGNKNPMLWENLSRIIRWYKGRCSFDSRKINANFKWQSRFYDHIIRNDKSFQNIKNYIINNPKKWDNDKFYG